MLWLGTSDRRGRPAPRSAVPRITHNCDEGGTLATLKGRNRLLGPASTEQDLVVTHPLAFPLHRAATLARVSERRLRAWAKAKFYLPHYDSGLYSFRDVVALRTLGILRDRGISLQSLKKAGAWLTERYEDPWASLRFGTAGKEFVYYDEQGKPVSVRKVGQCVIEEIPVEKVERAVADEAEQLYTRRRVDEIGQTLKKRTVQSNARCIAGTRITTSAIYGFHKHGYTVEQILRQYPILSEEDVRAAIKAEARNVA